MSRGIAFALSAITGMCAVAGSPARIFSAVRPLMPGRLMSIRMTSGIAAWAISMPRRPSLALSSRMSGRRASRRDTSIRLAGLSSTHSTVRSAAPTGTSAATALGGGTASAGRSRPLEATRSTQNTLPTPTVLSTPIEPPINSTRCLQTTRPMPVPSSTPDSWPSRLKGWNSWASLSAERPSPWSWKKIRMRPPGRAWQRTSTVPPTRLYLIAFDSRFTNSCLTRVRSARTCSGVSGARKCTAMPLLRACGSIIAWQSASTSASAIGSGDIDSLPDSISDRSRISLISSSRYQPACRIWSTLSFCAGVGGGVPESTSCAKPRIAFRGERSSWLMLDRKSDFAWLARSAVILAPCSSRFVSCRVRSSCLRSVTSRAAAITPRSVRSRS